MDEHKLISFEAFQVPEGRIIESEGRNISFSFEGQDQIEESHRSAVIEYTASLVENGFRYVMGATNGELRLSDKFTVYFANSENHGHQGSLMRASIPRLTAAVRDKENLTLHHLEQSQLTHELLHNITDEEDFPMFVEILYLIENGQTTRIQQIQELLQQGKLPSQYVNGLNKIAEWVQCPDMGELFPKLQSMGIETLKAIFKKRSLEYYQTEIELQK